MIRIGIDARIVRNGSSGLVNFTQNIIKSLSQKENLELYLFGRKKYKHIFKEFLANPNIHFVPAYFDDYFLSPINFFYEQFIFPFLVNKYHLDLFHNPFGFGIPLTINSSAILTVHDIIPLTNYDYLTRIQKTVYYFSLIISLYKAKIIITISESTKINLLHRFSFLRRKKILVIYDGFDNLSKLTSEKIFKKLQNNLPFNKPYIIYVGSATNRKNLPRLAEAFIILNKKYHLKHNLMIVSKCDRYETKKNYQIFLEKLKKEDLHHKIIHFPNISNEEKASLISNSEVLIYPSLAEGFGLPLLEGLSCHIPVCCSDLPVFHEVCNKAAYYVDPINPNSIAEGLYQCLTNDLLKRNIVFEGNKQINKYSWNKMSEQYMNIYNQFN